MPTTTINGINLYYEQDGQGKSLVLLSGYGCDINFWLPIRKELAKRFLVTLLDNRGAGRSDAPDSHYTISQMASDTAELILHLGLGKTHIIGSSMGTAIAQELAYQYPHLIDKIILTNPLIYLDAVRQHAFAWLLKLREQNHPLESLIEGVLPWLFSQAFLADPLKVELISQVMLNNPNLQSLRGQQGQFAALKNFNSQNWHHQIKAPTFIIASEDDLCTPVSQATKLASGIPGAKIHLFPNMGHMPIIENTDDYLQLTIDFL